MLKNNRRNLGCTICKESKQAKKINTCNYFIYLEGLNQQHLSKWKQTEESDVNNNFSKFSLEARIHNGLTKIQTNIISTRISWGRHITKSILSKIIISLE